mmetsp:Transcript_18896/g.57098  ORF Transcript_18896/g.57098 Transcript_18896/m.57098 type:complete len:147 (+) Transcript_18896:362-802(+)
MSSWRYGPWFVTSAIASAWQKGTTHRVNGLTKRGSSRHVCHSGCMLARAFRRLWMRLLPRRRLHSDDVHRGGCSACNSQPIVAVGALASPPGIPSLVWIAIMLLGALDYCLNFTGGRSVSIGIEDGFSNALACGGTRQSTACCLRS